MPNHPCIHALPQLETSAGSLGHGLGIATGMLYGLRLKNSASRAVVLMGDGECNEGSVWEAAMFAGKYRLNHLCYIIDRNNIQIDGMTEDIQPLEPLRAKFEAFNFHVIDIDGHNMREFVDACDRARAVYEKPVAIIAHTIPGKGVDFMEFDYLWHGKPPKPGVESRKALHDLRTLGGKIKSEHE